MNLLMLNNKKQFKKRSVLYKYDTCLSIFSPNMNCFDYYPNTLILFKKLYLFKRMKKKKTVIFWNLPLNYILSKKHKNSRMGKGVGKNFKKITRFTGNRYITIKGFNSKRFNVKN